MDAKPRPYRLIFKHVTTNNKIKVTLVESETNCEPVRQLLRTFVNWHFGRHVEDKALISEYFDKAAFEKEL
jgi:hypothetical protein